MPAVTLTSPSGATPRPLIVAAAILDSLTAPSRLLAARRTHPVHLAGQWEFPGGKVEPEESAEDALRRELHEELGVHVRIGSLIPAQVRTTGSARCDEGADWPLPGASRMRVWTAEVARGTASPLQGHDALTWLNLNLQLPWSPTHPLLSVPWLRPDIPILRSLHRTLAATWRA